MHIPWVSGQQHRCVVSGMFSLATAAKLVCSPTHKAALHRHPRHKPPLAASNLQVVDQPGAANTGGT
ncbi:MAG: hypothetical protein KBD82_20560, partial [Rhodoferax sp.]|uniref:hypothetical protein n=1 Tax=Rhodoferax sp. TaxID=50421 RepID=UPI001B592FFC